MVVVAGEFVVRVGNEGDGENAGDGADGRIRSLRMAGVLELARTDGEGAVGFDW